MDFTHQVYAVVSQIPKGKVMTYKSVAQAMHSKAYRAVGSALNKNRNPNVPCHRVINSDGTVGGFARGTDAKIRILRNEGIEIKGCKINLKGST